MSTSFRQSPLVKPSNCSSGDQFSSPTPRIFTSNTVAEHSYRRSPSVHSLQQSSSRKRLRPKSCSFVTPSLKRRRLLDVSPSVPSGLHLKKNLFNSSVSQAKYSPLTLSHSSVAEDSRHTEHIQPRNLLADQSHSVSTPSKPTTPAAKKRNQSMLNSSIGSHHPSTPLKRDGSLSSSLVVPQAPTTGNGSSLGLERRLQGMMFSPKASKRSRSSIPVLKKTSSLLNNDAVEINTQYDKENAYERTLRKTLGFVSSRNNMKGKSAAVSPKLTKNLDIPTTVRYNSPAPLDRTKKTSSVDTHRESTDSPAAGSRRLGRKRKASQAVLEDVTYSARRNRVPSRDEDGNCSFVRSSPAQRSLACKDRFPSEVSPKNHGESARKLTRML